MGKIKLKDEKKVKFTICVKPEIYNRMEKDMIKKSRLIEKLLEELRALPKTYSSKILTDDDVYSIKEYVEKYFFENQETFINNGTHIIDNDSSNTQTVKFLLNLFKRKEYKLIFTNVGERSVTEGSDW